MKFKGKPIDEILSERCLSPFTYLSSIAKDSLENSFVVFRGDTKDHTLIFNGYGWSDTTREEFVRFMCAEVWHMELKAQVENVYYCY